MKRCKSCNRERWSLNKEDECKDCGEIRVLNERILRTKREMRFLNVLIVMQVVSFIGLKVSEAWGFDAAVPFCQAGVFTPIAFVTYFLLRTLFSLRISFHRK